MTRCQGQHQPAEWLHPDKGEVPAKSIQSPAIELYPLPSVQCPVARSPMTRKHSSAAMVQRLLHLAGVCAISSRLEQLR